MELSFAERARGFRARVERAAPPIGRWAQTPMGAMHYVVAGDPAAPPLVLLHGASGNLLDFESSILSDLARDWRVVAVDRPGYGYSEARRPRAWGVPEQVEAIDALLTALGLQRFALLGHSYGVALAMAWCVMKPDKVTGVLAVSGGMIDWPGALGWRYRMGRRPVLGSAMGRLAPYFASPGLLRSELAEVFAPQPVPIDYAERAGVLLALRPRTFALNLKAMAEMLAEMEPFRARLRDIAAPVEVVNGDADEICAPTPAGPYATMAPTSRLTWLEGVGHMPHHVAPEGVLAGARRLRDRLPAAVPAPEA